MFIFVFNTRNYLISRFSIFAETGGPRGVRGPKDTREQSGGAAAERHCLTERVGGSRLKIPNGRARGGAGQ